MENVRGVMTKLAILGLLVIVMISTRGSFVRFLVVDRFVGMNVRPIRVQFLGNVLMVLILGSVNVNLVTPVCVVMNCKTHVIQIPASIMQSASKLCLTFLLITVPAQSAGPVPTVTSKSMPAIQTPVSSIVSTQLLIH